MAKSKATQGAYEPSAVYKLGERIHHKNWDVSGEVVEVGETDDGVSFITVDFETLGKKKLVMKTDLKLE